MRKVAVLYIVFLLLPSLALAQMDEFQKEFMKANRKYLDEKAISVTQRYLFTLGVADAAPFDSGYCYIEKNELKIHSEFNGVESFSDGMYVIRISNPAKYMVVSWSKPSDSSAPAFMFSEGLAGFKNVEKKNAGTELSQWKLTGGTQGVIALEITFDTRESRIRKISAELSPDNPLVSQIRPQSSGIRPQMFIRIDYTYSTELSKEQPQLSDYIHVENDLVTSAEKFKDYQIKFIK